MFKPNLPIFDSPIFDPLKPPGWQPDWDVFHGTSGDDWFGGGSGNDVMLGSVGADTFEGGAGSDTVNYSNTFVGTGVYVNLARGWGARGLAEGDKYDSVENVIGTHLADEVIGSDYNNDIRTGLGNDIIHLSAGADTIDGGGGNDLLLGYGHGIAVNLSIGSGTGGIALGDTYLNIENVLLLGDNNSVVGTTGNNWIAGRGANFTGIGGDGDDEFAVHPLGGSIDGGSGTDTVDFGEFYRIIGGKQPPTVGVVVDLAGNQAFANHHGGGPITTVTNIENAYGTTGSDVFIGNGADNVFTGDDGGDYFVFDHDGSGERDVITDYEAGIDFINLAATEVRDFADLADGEGRRFEQVGNDTVIYTGDDNEILLQGVRAADLSTGDFLF